MKKIMIVFCLIASVSYGNVMIIDKPNSKTRITPRIPEIKPEKPVEEYIYLEGDDGIIRPWPKAIPPRIITTTVKDMNGVRTTYKFMSPVRNWKYSISVCKAEYDRYKREMKIK